MKHIQRKTVLLGSVLGVAVGLFAGALVLGERLSPPVSGLCFGVAGILGGVAGSRLIMAPAGTGACICCGGCGC